MSTIKAQRSRLGIAAQWTLLECHLPGQAACAIGIILVDEDRNLLHLRIKPSWWSDLPDDENGLEVWQELAKNLQQWAEEMGPTQMLTWLASSFSHVVRLSDPQFIEVQEPEIMLNFLYNRYVCEPGDKIHSGAIETSRLTPPVASSRLRFWIPVAASIAVVSWMVQRHDDFRGVPLAKPPLHLVEITNTRLLETPVFVPIFANLQLEVQRPAAQRLLSLRKPAGHALRVLKTLPVSTAPRMLPLVRIQQPTIRVLPETISPTLLFSPLPEPPRFRRSTKLQRALRLVAIPLRFLATR